MPRLYPVLEKGLKNGLAVSAPSGGLAMMMHPRSDLTGGVGPRLFQASQTP